MTELAANYHKSLQTKELPNQKTRETATQEVLAHLNKKTDTDDTQSLGDILKYEVSQALMFMPNGKASGLDGILTELWKTLATDYEKSTAAGEKEEDRPSNLICLLLFVYNNIKEYGIASNSTFAKG
jgi:hypothetical protein